MKKGILKASAASLCDGEYINLIEDLDVKKNQILTFTAKIGEFSGIRIGHGEASYGGTFFEVDAKEIRAFHYTTDVIPTKSAEHGLDVSEYITVIISAGLSAEITVFTASGTFYVSDIPWMGCNGSIFVKSMGSSLYDCEFKWTCSDLACRVWVLGDSYLGLTSPARFPYYILKCGFEHWLACGYPGAGALSQLQSFENLLTLSSPDYAVWCLGMNNGDKGDTINEQWLECTRKFLLLCEQNDIVPIISTIPTTWKPNDDGTHTVVVENRPKNEWVRNSGCRFVDFEQAVGADKVEGWFEGMLSGDNVHPSELGAQALASRFMVDVPEIGWKF